ncbi:MAG: peptide/nickel transport system substrate-binding protein [Solirubrobacteraceae bacterium]|nr:peptide/nickel transport system substrate-binding protein [Solirubrobacteraceae bacterium]
MSRALMRTLSAALAVTAIAGAAGCGASAGDHAEPANRPGRLLAGTASANTGDHGTRGGAATMLARGDVDFIDPGRTYYSFAIGIMQALHRTLYSYGPAGTGEPIPDLAERRAVVSSGGRTVTVRIRPGVRFSPPVDREATSADVKYAIERGFTAAVGNGYAPAYFGDIVGAPRKPGAYREIPGIETPDARTVVFRLARGTGRALADALVMPLSAPVPKEYARPFDARPESAYGEHQVFTGPYMIANDASGRVVGYKPGESIHIVRNPSYRKAGDFRPAYVDEWTIRQGNEDSALTARRVLAGESLVSGDGGVPPTVLKQALRRNRSQISMKPSGGWRGISLNTQSRPFHDIDVRKAVLAGFDREALRLARGGEAVGPIAQHWIPPGIQGYEQAGGLHAPGDPDFMRNPKGDKALMASYFRAAGMASGRYEGDGTVLMVSDSAEPERTVAQIAEQQLRDMGFKTRLRLLERSTMLTRFCGVPGSGVDVCTGMGWLKDFPDAQTMLDPTFNGDNILPANNSNWPQLDVASLNAEIGRAKLVTDPAKRAAAWAGVDRAIVAHAPAVPYVFDYEPIVASKNVSLAQNAYSTLVDLSFTSLK